MNQARATPTGDLFLVTHPLSQLCCRCAAVTTR
uniref:Uncharacterized protein n=1 Tax=Anguilla anguilla TaxID=7936 RepID=A0A0E9RNC9_ANGAN